MIPIHVVGQRGLVFDIEDLKTLREKHNVCGTLTGILPQVPQQNVFMGLPLELMPEDVEYLVRHGIGYLVDDKQVHETAIEKYTEHDEEERLRRDEEVYERELAEYKAQAWEKRQQGKARQLAKKGMVFIPEGDDVKQAMMDKMTMDRTHYIDTTSKRTYGRGYTEAVEEEGPTTTTTVAAPAPAAYEMYQYLHDRGYFMSPGLRFGGQFLAYPGDPLRFHSHYTASGFGYDEQFNVLDIVSAGRLSTAVKKCWVVGAKDEDDEYKPYSIEWAGFG